MRKRDKQRADLLVESHVRPIGDENVKNMYVHLLNYAYNLNELMVLPYDHHLKIRVWHHVHLMDYVEASPSQCTHSEGEGTVEKEKVFRRYFIMHEHKPLTFKAENISFKW